MRNEEPSASYETAHVLFMDIVQYSLQPMDWQAELINLLQTTVRGTSEYQRARENNELISLATGDGMALVFLRDPLSPVRCALEIGAALQHQRKLKIRMGIHSGPVQRHADIQEQVNVVGGGINTAQRVMDCGDAGHILLSRNVAEVLEQISEWRGCLEDLGVHEVKHGVKLQLYSLSKDSVGSREMPRKLAAPSTVVKPEPTSSRETPSGLRDVSRRAVLFAMVFIAALGVTVASEAWLDTTLASQESIGMTAQAALKFSGLYRRIVAAPRSPIPRYTVVVEIDPERDPGSVSLYDLCRQRKMLAALVARVAAGMPSAIVIDKYFGTTECPGNTNSTLINTLADVNAKVPVVVGRRINGAYLEPSLFSTVPKLQDAIVNIDRDSRKLPLEWQAFPSKEDMQRNQSFAWHETLALAAAKTYEKGHLAERHPRLAELLNPPPRNPYISFLDVGQFQPFRFLAGYILCGREVKPGEDATACPAAPQALSALSGKIVLIGDISSQDQHPSVVGQIPGIYLQANFIEALLDDRYYEGFRALDFILGFLFLASLEIVLFVFRDSWSRRLAAIGILALALLLVLYIVITDFHRYVDPVPFIALALLIRAMAMNLPYLRETSRAPSAA